MILFSKINVGKMELKNRIVMPPMGTRLANPDGTVSRQMIDYYVRRAKGGVGLVTVEIAQIDPVHTVPLPLRISDDNYIAGLTTLAEAIRAGGARASVQLHHPGRQAFSKTTGAQPVSASPIATGPGYDVPRELTVEEIGAVVEQYAQAARRAREAGFDAVELHGAHGYLVAQFLSPESNKRTDRYGGSTDARARFALEVVAAIRSEVGPDYPVMFRISADEHSEEGLTLTETRAIVTMLEKAGIDAVSVSAGGGSTLEWSVQPVLLPRGCNVSSAAQIRQVVRIPVMVAGRIDDPKLAEKILEEGKADLIGMARPLLADPDLPRKAQEGRSGDIRKCIACNSCLAAVFTSPQIRCLMNPETGKEGIAETRAETSKNVVVLGAGPAGLEAARVARLRGHQVTLYDENKMLGGRWSWMIRPFITDRLRILKELGVSVELGTRPDLDSLKGIKPDAVIVTVGRTPVVPPIPGIDQTHVLLADDVLEEKAKPWGKVVVLGAGNIGFETAEFLCRKGLQVTIVENSRRTGYGLEMNTRKVMTERLLKRGVGILAGCEVLRINSAQIHLKDPGTKEHAIAADCVVVALGSKPDNSPVEALRGGNFELVALDFCERPIDAYMATELGAAGGRKI